MEIIEKNDVSRAIMERFCAKCSHEDNCIDACTVRSILDIIDKHTITLPSCDDCEYHEDIGVLPDETCYCNFWKGTNTFYNCDITRKDRINIK